MLKVCTRCGKEKPEEEFYKVKYKGKEPKHSYTVCKTCMAIEQRRRYLEKVAPDSPALAKIEELYEKHRAAGRSVPGVSSRRPGSAIDDEVRKMLEEA